QRCALMVRRRHGIEPQPIDLPISAMGATGNLLQVRGMLQSASVCSFASTLATISSSQPMIVSSADAFSAYRNHWRRDLSVQNLNVTIRERTATARAMSESSALASTIRDRAPAAPWVGTPA